LLSPPSTRTHISPNSSTERAVIRLLNTPELQPNEDYVISRNICLPFSVYIMFRDKMYVIFVRLF